MAELNEPEGEVSNGPAGYRYNFDTVDEYQSTAELVSKDGRLDEAVDVLREATVRFPGDPVLLYNLGMAIFMDLREDWAHLDIWEDLAGQEALAEEAILAFQAAIDRDPTMVEAYNAVGSLYALRGRRRDALAVWEKSLELKPDQPEVRSDLELYRSKLSAPPDVLPGMEALPEDKVDTQF